MPDPVVHARRLVAQRCLYGVDKNRFAVDLARMSLWLVTLAKDEPFTFVDHALRHGDSLVGLDLAAIRRFDWEVDRARQLDFFYRGLDRAVLAALDKRQRILELAREEGAGFAQQKEAVLEDAEAALEVPRLVGDCLVGAWFAHDKDKAKDQERRERLSVIAAWLTGDEPEARVPPEVRGWAEEIRAQLPVFHWHLEFPEIPVQRKTGTPMWPWLLGLLLLVGVGLVVWAGTKDDDEAVTRVGPATMVAEGADATVDTRDDGRGKAVTAAVLVAERQPRKLADRAFEIDDASVMEVSGDKVFWVSPKGSHFTYLAVNPTDEGSEGRYHIDKGMRVALWGVIKTLDADAARSLSLDQAATDKAGGADAIYLDVQKIDIFENAKSTTAAHEAADDARAAIAEVAANADRFDHDRMVVEEHVFFGYDSAALTASGRAKLDAIAAELKAAGTDWKLLRIKGYADQRGPKAYNQDLSRDRARAVADYLATVGIDAGKLDVKAYGESRPVEDDASSPEEYQKNRRVEFTMVRGE